MSFLHDVANGTSSAEAIVCTLSDMREKLHEEDAAGKAKKYSELQHISKDLLLYREPEVAELRLAINELLANIRDDEAENPILGGRVFDDIRGIISLHRKVSENLAGYLAASETGITKKEANAWAKVQNISYHAERNLRNAKNYSKHQLLDDISNIYMICQGRIDSVDFQSPRNTIDSNIEIHIEEGTVVITDKITSDHIYYSAGLILGRSIYAAALSAYMIKTQDEDFLHGWEKEEIVKSGLFLGFGKHQTHDQYEKLLQRCRENTILTYSEAFLFGYMDSVHRGIVEYTQKQVALTGRFYSEINRLAKESFLIPLQLGFIINEVTQKSDSILPVLHAVSIEDEKTTYFARRSEAVAFLVMVIASRHSNMRKDYRCPRRLAISHKHPSWYSGEQLSFERVCNWQSVKSET